MALFRIPVRIAWNYGSGSPGVNVWHGRTTGEWPPGPDAQDQIDALQDFYSGLVLQVTQGVTWSFDGTVQGVGPNEGDSVTLDGWSVGGSVNGPALPTSQQICIDWTTGTGGRSGRGRTFIGPLQAGTCGADGLPTSGAVAAVNAAAASLVSNSQGFANGALGVWSEKDQQLRDFSGGSARRAFAVLRSRRD